LTCLAIKAAIAPTEDGCPDQLGPWVFANGVISCLAILNMQLSSYVFKQHLRSIIVQVIERKGGENEEDPVDY